MAAGAATRFGSPKQLARFQGQILLQRCIESANAIFPGRVSVVLGANAEKIKPEISGAAIIFNPRWQQGLGSSIAYGTRHIDPEAEGVLILLADQIHITSAHIGVMAEAFVGDNIVAAHYCGARGVPAIFPRCYFRRLQDLTADSGAKALLNESATADVPMTDIHLPDAAVDIDRPEDLHKNKKG